MEQAQIQQLRKLVAAEITDLHQYKLLLKRNINFHWKLANPDTDGGKDNFYWLNITKNELRSVSKRIEKLSSLIKTLKKEERNCRFY